MPLAERPAKIAGQLVSDWLPMARESASAWIASFVKVVVMVRSPKRGETRGKEARNVRALFVGVVVCANERAVTVRQDVLHDVPTTADRIVVNVERFNRGVARGSANDLGRLFQGWVAKPFLSANVL